MEWERQRAYDFESGKEAGITLGAEQKAVEDAVMLVHDYNASPEVLKESMKMILNEDATDLLPNIDAPTLLIWGGLDRDTPIDQGRKMEKLIPNAGLVEYPYGSHFAYLENIQNVNVVLNEFLKDLK